MPKTLLNSLHRGRNAKTKTDISEPVLDNVQLDSFMSFWNELTKLSTTKPEDMFAILKNLLNFNAGQVI